MTHDPLFQSRGGYRNLKAFTMAEIISDATAAFCRRFVDPRSRTTDQMIQAARSCKQNIAEGSLASATSSSTELKLTSVARASLEELMLDYEDYLRHNQLSRWEPDSQKQKYIAAIAKTNPKSYGAYQPYIEEKSAETAANTMICIIKQTNYLLDQLIKAQKKGFVENGGFSEQLCTGRSRARKPKP